MLTPNAAADYEKIKNLFSAALELAPERRREFLAAAAEDKNLIAEVLSLLEAREAAGEFLNDVSAAESVQNSLDRHDKFLGRTIDKYRIEREIGRGGMGVVYLASREDFRQQVALKLIKRGMDSEAILERFHREREILAALNHPYIARLTDGGTTGDDLPFFVMEHVEGVPVDEFCRNKNLSEKETLELFRRICEALIFAHQKLIVHRDLKPSNILVTKDGVPKLLDFGIAKLLDSTAAETQTSQRALTPAYASPEQLRGEAVDTTSDVYSLGKILAQLLLGEHYDELNFSLAENQTGRKYKLNADLQNILATSLREDRARRYNSVEKFSEDVRRYLVGLPVSARRDTFSYRAAKFLKRNRIAAAVSAVFVLTLLVGSAATLWQAREAKREREIAERRLENLRAMSDAFTREIHDAIEKLPGSLPARQMLMRHAVQQLDALAVESGDNPALQEELAQAYFNSARLPDMLLSEKTLTLEKGIAVYRKLIAADPKNTRYQEQMVLGEISLGDITKVRGSVAGALKLTENAVSTLEQIAAQDADNEARLVNLAGAYDAATAMYILKGDVEAASQMTRKEFAAIEKIRKINAANPEIKDLQAIAQIRAATEKTMAGEYQTAIETLSGLLAEYQTAQNRAPNDTGIRYYLCVLNRRLAEALEKNGSFGDAAEHYRRAAAMLETLAADSPKDFGYHRNAAAAHILYGKLQLRRNQTHEALENFRRAAELSRYVVENDADNSESQSDVARASAGIGYALILTDRKKEGFDSLTKAVASLRERCTPDAENFELKRDYLQARDWLNSALNGKSSS